MSFFGELYLRTTRPFLGAETTDREVDYLVRAFADLAPAGAVVDLGCGHGRHATRLQGRLAGGRTVIGIDFDPLSLSEREGPFPAVRGDFRALPFRSGSLAGAFAWYSSLFTFDEETEAAIFTEIARCLAPSARLVVQTNRREYYEGLPPTRFDELLPDGGGRVKEINFFDEATGRNLSFRELLTPDGRSISAPFAIRYYRVPELAGRFEAHGFRVRWVHGGLGGEPVDGLTRDLIMGVERNG